MVALKRLQISQPRKINNAGRPSSLQDHFFKFVKQILMSSWQKLTISNKKELVLILFTKNDSAAAKILLSREDAGYRPVHSSQELSSLSPYGAATSKSATHI